MGTVKTEITLKNAGDMYMASTLVITEDIRQRLGLAIEERQPINFANGSREICGITEPVQVRWKDRWAACSALVVPGTKKILLGAIPLEAMDLIIHPKEQALAYAHGESWEAMVL